MLSDMPEMCQDFFNFFAEIFVAESVFCRATTYRGSPLGDLPQIYGTAYQVREETDGETFRKIRGESAARKAGGTVAAPIEGGATRCQINSFVPRLNVLAAVSASRTDSSRGEPAAMI